MSRPLKVVKPIGTKLAEFIKASGNRHENRPDTRLY